MLIVVQSLLCILDFSVPKMASPGKGQKISVPEMASPGQSSEKIVRPKWPRRGNKPVCLERPGRAPKILLYLKWPVRSAKTRTESANPIANPAGGCFYISSLERAF